MDKPQRYVLGIAYQAGPDPRIATGADGSRDFFTPDELEKAAWEFNKSSRSIGIHHVDGTEGHADVVESYIWRGPDWDLGDGVVVKAGDWLIGSVLDEPTWDRYEKGEFTGFSPQGTAKRRRPTPDTES
jgi:hypothetical protein